MQISEGFNIYIRKHTSCIKVIILPLFLSFDYDILVTAGFLKVNFLLVVLRGKNRFRILWYDISILIFYKINNLLYFREIT